jgi:hypothetical protein
LHSRPWKERGRHNWVLGVRPPAVRWNSGSSSPVLAGETAGEVHVVTRMRFGPEERWERHRQASTAVPGGCDRGSGCSGEWAVRPGQKASVPALVGPRAGARMVEPMGKQAGGGFHRDGGHGEGGRAQRGGKRRRRRPTFGFIRGCAGQRPSLRHTGGS